jgi:hypothetical protein
MTRSPRLAAAVLVFFSCLFCLSCATGRPDAQAGASIAAPPDTHMTPVPIRFEVPSPPPDTLLQFFCRSDGHLERFMSDGRWLVAEAGAEPSPKRPMSYYGGTGERLDEGGLRRIREAMNAVGFFTLPARVQGTLQQQSSAPLLPGGQGAALPLRYALSATRPDGALHVVEVDGELRSLPTFGVLEPLLVALDRDAWGRWRLE